MKFVIPFSLFLFSILPSFATNKVLIKANILRGEAFVTAATHPEDIENVVGTILETKGYKVLEKIAPNGEYLLVDLFVFQFPAEMPTVTLTIRSGNNIHYIDQEKKILFIDRSQINRKIAAELAERIPSTINTDDIYKPSFSNIISYVPTSPMGIAIRASINNNEKKYSSSFIWQNDNAPDFIIRGGIPIYLMYISDYKWLRNKLKKESIKLKLQISERARFRLMDIEASFVPTPEQYKRFQELIDSFPLWAIDKPIETIELIISKN